MHIVIVHIQVKPEYLDAFIEATQDNVRNSLQEAGVLRFDFLQQKDDPTRFALYEVYHTPEDQLAHRETAHYLRWRDTATDMMAAPRQGVTYTNLLPEDATWR
jgi:quinol monooxygenase YgiN